jgi:hypothetical protein
LTGYLAGSIICQPRSRHLPNAVPPNSS